jgi:hypothetical protein
MIIEKSQAISRATDIISSGLRASLDFSEATIWRRGWPASMTTWCLRLIHANVKNDLGALQRGQPAAGARFKRLGRNSRRSRRTFRDQGRRLSITMLSMPAQLRPLPGNIRPVGADGAMPPAGEWDGLLIDLEPGLRPCGTG